MKKIISLVLSVVFIAFWGIISYSAEEISVNNENVFDLGEMSIGDRKSFEFEIEEEGTYKIELLFDADGTSGKYSVKNSYDQSQVDDMEIYCKGQNQSDYNVFLTKGQYFIDFFCTSIDKVEGNTSGRIIISDPSNDFSYAENTTDQMGESTDSMNCQYMNESLPEENSSIATIGIVIVTVIVVVVIICLSILFLSKRTK